MSSSRRATRRSSSKEAVIRPALLRQVPPGLRPLQHRDFRLYWAGYGVSNTGTWIETTGVVWTVYALTDSPAMFGMVGLARAIPFITLSPIAGVCADRVDRRRLLFATQGTSMVLSAWLAVTIASGHVQLWQIFLQVSMQAGVRAFDASARNALFPELVPRERLSDAVTLTFFAGRSSAFIGPIIGGIAIARLGSGAPWLLNAVSSFVLMFAVRQMRPVSGEARPRTQLRTDVLEGIRFVTRTPILRGLILMEIILGVFQVNEVIITIIASDVLHTGPEGLGLLLSASALGSIAGVMALLLYRNVTRKGRFVLACLIMYGLALCLLSSARSFWTAFAVLVVLGLLDSFASVTRSSIVQELTPSEMRGRVLGVTLTITGGVSPLAQAQSGLLTGALSGPLALAASGVGLCVAGATVRFRIPELWSYGHRDAQPALPSTDLQDAQLTRGREGAPK